MFGYITADPTQLPEAEICRYGGCYCGLCRSLQKRHGLWGRLTLTYDMTFLILTLSSLYEPEETAASGRCPVHPLRKKEYWQNRFTDYAADMNVLLAWWNCMDDWEDEKKFSRRLLAALLKKKYLRIREKYPRQERAIADNIQLLHRFESGQEVSADKAAGCFGDLMGELFVYKENDYWSPALREMGQGLGRFIYIMDACIDYEDDKKHQHANPLISLDGGTRSREGDYNLLSMLLSDCTRAFEHMPLVQDAGLLRNILYAGVWQKYHQAFHMTSKENEEQ